jgi:hypothetical protein
MAEIPNYSINFSGAQANPMDAFKNVMGLMQMKQEMELAPLRKEQMTLATEAAKRDAELAPMRKDILGQNLEQGSLAIAAGKREAALAPLREEVLVLQRDTQATNLAIQKADLSLAPEKKAELQLMNQVREKQLAEATLKLQNAEKAQERQAIYQDRMVKLANNPNATAKDYAEIAAVLDPEQADSVRSTFKMFGEEKAQNKINFTAQVFSALNSGEVDYAKRLITDQAQGLRNSGNETEAKGWDTWSEILKDPNRVQFAKDHYGILLSTMPEGEKAVKSALEFTKSRKLESMPEDVRKLVNTSVGEAEKLRNQANQATDIADRFAAAAAQADTNWWDRNTSTGSKGAFGEWLKSQFGTENDITQMRKDYTAFRNTQAAALLKDFRPASDTDVAMVMKGFLPETADMNQVASYLKGMAKVAKYQTELESGKADWVQQVGTLGKTQSELNINGVTVPAGTSYIKYTGMIAQRLVIDDIIDAWKANRIDEATARGEIEKAQKRKF